METMFAAAALLSPGGLFVFVLIPAIAIFLASGPRLSAVRLISGYLGALCALAIVVAASSYVSPEESTNVWHVPPDRYWGALVELFVSTYVVSAFAATVGISVVGLPVLVWLEGKGQATAPRLIIAAAVISAGVAIALYGMMHSSSNIPFFATVAMLVVSHVICATAFALAARLPWAMSVASRENIHVP